MTSPAFEEAYKRLNPKQREAVDAVEGTVMVVAGPGTGKTQILTLRIANILRKTDAGPEAILALTFTESGAHAIRKRLLEMIGSAAYRVTISTFHGFCNSLIQRYPEDFPEIISRIQANDIDQIRIMEKILEESKFEKIKSYGDPFFYLRPILQKITELKRENISPAEFEKLAKAEQGELESLPDLYHEKGAHKGKMKGEHSTSLKYIEKNLELAVAYRKYQEALAAEKLYDYDDMIMETVRVLEKNQDLLLRLQETYQYLLADEHQDANNAQNKILELLSNFHPNPNLFIVGDEKQAIFRFQGASLDNFLYFKKAYPDAMLIQLEDNYRSSQTILDAAHSLIGNNAASEDYLRVSLTARGEPKSLKEKILLYPFMKEESEPWFIAEDIQKKISAGVSPRQIAVLYRNNKDAFPLIRVLDKTGVPFVVQSDQDLLADTDIRTLIFFLRAVNAVSDPELLSQALFVGFLRIDPLDAYKAIRVAHARRMPLLEVVGSKKLLGEAGVEKLDGFAEIGTKLLRWSAEAKGEGVVDFFERLIREAGFLEYCVGQENSLDLLSKLESFFAEIKALEARHKDYRLRDFVEYLDRLDTHQIRVKRKDPNLFRDTVHLMTAHKSKGLEFEYVYVMGATDKRWGSRRQNRYLILPIENKNAESVDDERRLFYVALTRAKKQVIMSYGRESQLSDSQLPTQFIAEIHADHLEEKPTEEIERALEARPGKSFLPKLQAGISLRDRDYLRQLFLEQGMSVTSLNNYLECPWKYFFTNLIQLPQAKTKHQLYGSAVHAALQAFFEKYRQDEVMPKKDFLAAFEANLSKQPISQGDYEDTLAKGRKALGGYYDAYAGSWTKNLLAEFSVGGVHLECQLGGKPVPLLLKGKLDKLEILDGSQVNVVDYKTQKPATRNEIEGKTKSSSGNLKRQLAFYKLLLNLFDRRKYDMVSGEIDFLEPDEKGRYHKEKFEVTDADVSEVEEQVRKVASEIFAFEFWDRQCEEKGCAFCPLSLILKEGQKA